METNSFENYLEKPNSLSFEKMRELHDEMLKEIGSDSDALELYEELVETCTEYANIRANWNLLSREERAERDPRRTSCHNSVIISFNMLSRYLKMQGKKAQWRNELGFEEDDRLFRKTIGDFGCYIVFVNSLCAR